MRALTLVAILLLGLVCAAPAADEVPLAALESANWLLKAELELAKSAQVYFDFDLAEKKVRFKSSGIAVAELPVSQLRIWGPSTGDKLRTLTGKESLVRPERESILIPGQEGEKPGEAKKEEGSKEEKKFDLQALELSDMPRTFRLRLDDATVITVRPAPQGTLEWLLAKGLALYWHLSRPLISDWHFLHRKPYTEILLIMPAKDAQLLYWSFAEGTRCLIRWPEAT
jgi:hypothetical protein